MVREIWRCRGIFQPDASGRPDLYFLAAGIARVNIYRFMLYTFLGALPWCYLLAYIGVKMGEQWEHLRDYFHQFDIVIGIAWRSPWGIFSGPIGRSAASLRSYNQPMLSIYNTLTRKKGAVSPLLPNTVRMYVCGVTVYDYCHIGHARSALVFDVIRRYLEFSDYQGRICQELHRCRRQDHQAGE